MPNPIKYFTGSESQALKKGTMFFGTGDVGKGPTDITGYYNGVSPSSGGYVIYLFKNDAPGSLAYHNATNDTQLITFTNNLANTSFTSATQCLNYFATQTDKMVFNIDYPPIVTSGLVLSYDAGFVSSYSTSGTSWYDNGPSVKTQTLLNGPTYSGGTIVFDGTDDYTNIPSINGPSLQTIELFFNANSTSSKTLLMGLPFYRPRISLRNNVVNVYYGMETGTGDIIFTFNSISTSQWYQLVYTYSGSTNHKCYLNTVEGTRTSNGSAISGTPSFTSIQLGPSAGSESYFNGQISVFRLYDRVLSSSEIQQNYEAIGQRYTSLSVQYLVVAGGGSGGKRDSGAGGAGGLLTGVTTSLSTNTNYSIIVGAGAAAPTLTDGGGGTANSAAGNNGSNSTFNTTTSTGGGGGGVSSVAGKNGGSGGGGGNGSQPGSGVSGQGYSGGTVNIGYAGGGGGGAGEPGGNTGSPKFASGGTGLYISEYTSLGGSPAGWFAGGGGGSYGNGDVNYNSPGGKGGGGTGGRLGNPTPINGSVNTGGGGGAQGDYQISTGPAGNGGSGIIIIRIPDVYGANFSSGVTASVTKSGGYKYYKVTATSTTSETVSFY